MKIYIVMQETFGEGDQIIRAFVRKEKADGVAKDLNENTNSPKIGYFVVEQEVEE